jgi:hypothetical protein
MKLRCITNSIRLRLRKSELDALMHTGRVTEMIGFPDGSTFAFALLQEEREDLSVQWEGGHLRIILPRIQARQWAATDQVGIEAFVPLPGDEQLHLLIEKDFPCKDRPDEDKADTFQELAEKEENPAC